MSDATTIYPIGELLLPAHARSQLKDLGVLVGAPRSLLPGLEVRAISTGEKRAPKAGEWFLSGAIVEAYFAADDLRVKYQIARLVVVEIKTITTETIIHTLS